MSDNLVKQLRAKNAYCAPDFSTPIADPVKLKAADRIEELEAKLRQSEMREAAMKSANEEARKFLREKSIMAARIEELEAAVKLNQDLDAISLDHVADLEAKLAEARLSELAALGQADEAYTAQLELEAACNHSEAMALGYATQVEELEAKLAKAVEALVSLEKQASITSSRGAVTGPHWLQLSISILKARTTLAELKGEKR